MSDRLLTRKEVLTRLGRSSAQLYRDIEAGSVPPPTKRLGKSPRWLESQFNAFMAAPATAVTCGPAPQCRDLSEYFYRVLITDTPSTRESVEFVANTLNVLMLEAKWCGTYTVPIDDSAAEFIWPRESGTTPRQMMDIIDKFFKEKARKPTP